MANLPKKNINPVLALLANFCCLGFLGYLLIGQVKKGVLILIISLVFSVLGVVGTATVILPSVFGLLYLGLLVMVLIDVYRVAADVEAGLEVDENEYKLELLYKIMTTFQKDAVYRG